MILEEGPKVMEILQEAIQMEVDGKEFYQRAGRESGNELAKKLFQALAAEENDHCKKFEEIYEVLKKGRGWPDVKPPSGTKNRLKSIFAKATKELGTGVKVAGDEIEAIKVGMDMENKSYAFYQARSAEATYPIEKEFYLAVAAEERGHYLALVDSYEYLSDPVGWFVRTEHPSLNGA